MKNKGILVAMLVLFVVVFQHEPRIKASAVILFQHEPIEGYIVQYEKGNMPRGDEKLAYIRRLSEVALDDISWRLSLSKEEFAGKVFHTYQYALVGMAVSLTAEQAARVAGSPLVANVERGGQVQALVEDATIAIGSDAANLIGGRGDGVVAAVIDTGVETRHELLGKSNIPERNFYELSDGSLNFSYPAVVQSYLTTHQPLKLLGNRVMYHDDTSVWLYDSDTSRRFKVAEGVIIKSASLSRTCVVYSVGESTNTSKSTVYIYDINSGQRKLEMESDYNIDKVELVGSILLYEEVTSNGAYLKIRQFGSGKESLLAGFTGQQGSVFYVSYGDAVIYNPRFSPANDCAVTYTIRREFGEEDLNFPNPVKIVDLEGDLLLYLTCSNPNAYWVRNIRTGEERKIEQLAVPVVLTDGVRSPGFSLGGAIGKDVFWYKPAISPYISGQDNVGRKFLLNVATPANFYDASGRRVCFISDDRRVWCHDFRPEADYATPNIYNNVVVDGFNFIADGPPLDDNGHGTHVASTFLAVAPGAKVVAYKALDYNGFGNGSDIVAAIDKAMARKVQIIIMSLGQRGNQGDYLSTAANNAAISGITVVVAAGNSGSEGNDFCRNKELDPTGSSYSICSPALGEHVLAVGALTKPFLGERVAGFSSRGPVRTSGGFDYPKPDISAPGVDVCAAGIPYMKFGLACGNGKVKLSGTSMATPVVAGAVAILKSLHPSWGPVEIARRLKETVFRLSDRSSSVGSGRVNIFSAIAGTPLPGGLVDGASYSKDRLAPGGIASLFGVGLSNEVKVATTLPLPVNLGGASVEIVDSQGGVYVAPLFFVSPGQINFQIPYEVVPGIVRIYVTCQGRRGSSLWFWVAQESQAIFTRNSSGSGVGSMVSVNTGTSVTEMTPVTVGDNAYVSVFATSLGQSSPAVATGQAVPSGVFWVLPPPVAKLQLPNGAEVSLPVTFSGKAPGFVGLDQVNLHVPASVLEGVPAGQTIKCKLLLCSEKQCSNSVEIYLIK